MLKIGITGGIGSGKTVVCRIFKLLGIPVYNADIHSRILTDTDPEIIEKIVSLFGREIYGKTGLERKKLAGIIFNEPDALKKVNRIIHPKVREHFLKWCDSQKNVPYVIQEAAILFESGAYQFMDRYITVTASEETRISRVLAREKTSRERIRAIISNQISEEEKIRRSHFVIFNETDQLIIPQVLEIHKQLADQSEGHQK